MVCVVTKLSASQPIIATAVYAVRLEVTTCEYTAYRVPRKQAGDGIKPSCVKWVGNLFQHGRRASENLPEI